MAIISVRAAGDLPVISDYIPLISWYFFLGQLYTFISFVWFAACNFFKTSSSLPFFLQKLAKLLIKIKQYANLKKKIENLTSVNITKEKEFEALISALNNFALFVITITMFASYLTIWLIISS